MRRADDPRVGQKHVIPGAGVAVTLMDQHADGGERIGVAAYSARWLGGYVQVERALQDKASKYPEIGAARAVYVIAICSGSWFAIAEEQTWTGVYGTIQATFDGRP